MFAEHGGERCNDGVMQLEPILRCCRFNRRWLSAHNHPMRTSATFVSTFFRGFALVWIFVDHIPGNVFAKFTLTNFGFADASEVFVLLAGYAGFLAYSRPFKSDNWHAGLLKIGARIGDPYLAHLTVLIRCITGLVGTIWFFRNRLISSRREFTGSILPQHCSNP
jgi:hypothetical protein